MCPINLRGIELEKDNNNEWIGIDLGTCNSVVSYAGGGRPEALKFSNGDRGEIIPSAVLFNSPDECSFGRTAIQKGKIYHESLATLFKRKIADEDFKYHIKYAKSSESSNNENYSNASFVFDNSVFLENEFILDILSETEGFKGKIYIPDCVVQNLTDIQSNSDFSGKAITAVENIKKFMNTEFYGNADFNYDDSDFEDGDILLTDTEKIFVNILRKNPDFIFVTSDSLTRNSILSVNENTKVWNTEEWKNHIRECGISDDNEGYINISPLSVAAKFLENIRQLASEKLGSEVTNAVITVPAAFEFTEKEAIRNACRAAGFCNVEIECEPIAAGIRYFMNTQEHKYVLVYDFGGGTFDTTIISVTPDPESIFNVKFKIEGTSGDANLGGDDITRLILKEIFDNILVNHNINMNSLEDSELSYKNYQYNYHTLYDACENCKIAFSDGMMEEYSIDADIWVNDEEKVHYSYVFRLNVFENLIKLNIIPKVNKCLERVINENYGGVLKEDISDILLVGGTSSIKVLQENIKDFFGKQPINDGNLATLVSEGASMKAYAYSEAVSIINPEDVPPMPVTKTTLKNYGIGLDGFKMDIIVAQGVELPVTVSKTYAIARDNPKTIQFGLHAFTKNISSEDEYYSTLSNDVENVAVIKISELPSGLVQQDTFVDVEFCLSENYTVSLTASLKHKDGTPIEDGRTVKAELKSV